MGEEAEATKIVYVEKKSQSGAGCWIFMALAGLFVMWLVAGVKNMCDTCAGDGKKSLAYGSAGLTTHYIECSDCKGTGKKDPNGF